MSTRYVWGKFSIAVAYEENTSTVRQTHIPIDQKTVYGSTDGVSKDTVTGKYTLINPTAIGPGAVFGNFGSSAVMTYLAEFPTSTVVYAGTTYMNVGNLTGSCWRNTSGVLNYVYLGQYFGPYSPISCAKYEFVQTNKKGSLQGYASAATNSAYPTDGVSGSYWYEYQGSDDIDARGCNSLLSYAPPEKSARIKPYKVSCSLSPTGMDVSISMKPPTMSSNPLFRSLMA